MPVAWIILVGLLWAVVIGLTALVLGLNRRLTMFEALANGGGEPAATNLFSEALASGALLPHREQILGPAGERRRTVLLFLRSGCEPCHALSEKLMEAARHAHGPAASDYELVVITDPEAEATFRNLGRVIVDHDEHFTRTFGVRATPSGLAVDRHGVVCSKSLLASVDDIERLAESCVGVSGDLLPA